MSESTRVQCQECGHEWDTVADYPQCSDPNDECGRSRNVEPVSDSNSEGGALSEREAAPSGDSQSESEWTPLFDAQESETEPVEDMSFSEPPELEDDERTQVPDSNADADAPEFEGEQELPELEPEDIKLFVKTPFDMAARSRGEHWELSDDELGQLSHAYAKVGNKYAPYLLAEHAPEVMAVMVTVAVCGPRLAEDKQNAKKAEKEAVDDEPQEATDRRTDSPAESEFNEDDFSYAKV